ncbi:MAG: zf-TFIIB domain-containing protein [Pseudobutyrivibrio sp.]|nr:zf-TFIIB domain-containing protein [Pseudobutyrivibrio sp.]
MNNFRYRMAQFFAGRTGVDALGRFITFLSLIFMILTMITHSNIVYLIAVACLAYSIWRMFSKNYQKRYSENQWFLTKTAKIRYKFNPRDIRNKIERAKYTASQRKMYAIFKCPNCKQKLRAPRGRGKIQVTCSKCRTQFIKKV